MFNIISSIIHFYSSFTSISQTVNEIAIKELCKNFLVVDKGTFFFKDNVVCLLSAPRVKKWSIRSPKICRVPGSSRSSSLSLFVEVMYIYSSGRYTGQNLNQFSLLQNVARGNFFGVWQRATDCSCSIFQPISDDSIVCTSYIWRSLLKGLIILRLLHRRPIPNSICERMLKVNTSANIA